MKLDSECEGECYEKKDSYKAQINRRIKVLGNDKRAKMEELEAG